MKKFITLFSALLVALAVAACGKQTPVEKLRKITDEVEANYSSYTEEDIDKVMLRLDEIEKDMQQYEYTEEELREIGRLNGRLSAYLTKAFMNNLGSTLGDFAEEFGAGVEGFFEVLAGDSEVGEDIDDGELSEDGLREKGRRKGKEWGRKTRRFAIELGSGIEGFAEGFEEEMEQLSDNIEKGAEDISKKAERFADDVEEEMEQISDNIENGAEDVSEKADDVEEELVLLIDDFEEGVEEMTGGIE